MAMRHVPEQELTTDPRAARAAARLAYQQQLLDWQGQRKSISCPQAQISEHNSALEDGFCLSNC